MAEYKTEQRKQLIDFMTEHSELSLSIDKWIEKMGKELEAAAVPSRSTVYRTMQKLEKEGRVLRCVEGNSHTCNYQLAVCTEHQHLHLKCIDCGTLIHMSREASESLRKTIFNDNNFNIDQNQTVIYGKCIKCGQV